MSGESASNFASLTALKMAALAESNVTYEQLADVEREFEDVETEIIRKQYEMSKPIYEKRQSLVSQIPNFWPLVLEQAPPDIDEFIQPLDSNLLLSALTSISVSRFELDENKEGGDPRSVAIRFEFSENDHFEDRVLEKKFWYRHADAGDFSGLVSEPVAINWKDGKDLTDGLLGLVKKVWDEDPDAFRVPSPEEQKEAAANKGKKEKKPLSAAQKALKEKMDATGLGGVSFFAWFGYVGRRVTAEESTAAVAKMREDMKARKEGKPAPNASESKDEEDHEMGDDEDDEDDEDDFEIFPPGDELAQAIVMDLWPDALKYFTQAQELEEGVSDMEFESDDDEDGDEPPSKKAKA